MGSRLHGNDGGVVLHSRDGAEGAAPLLRHSRDGGNPSPAAAVGRDGSPQRALRAQRVGLCFGERGTGMVHHRVGAEGTEVGDCGERGRERVLPQSGGGGHRGWDYGGEGDGGWVPVCTGTTVGWSFIPATALRARLPAPSFPRRRESIPGRCRREGWFTAEGAEGTEVGDCGERGRERVLPQRARRAQRLGIVGRGGGRGFTAEWGRRAQR